MVDHDAEIVDLREKKAVWVFLDKFYLLRHMPNTISETREIDISGEFSFQ